MIAKNTYLINSIKLDDEKEKLQLQYCDKIMDDTHRTEDEVPETGTEMGPQTSSDLFSSSPHEAFQFFSLFLNE